ncbi:hypothetical protein GE061_013465 [Apolygus lucorum]|uniref:Uncharacterized protein n=1 Tax=Apolygus lucorum TaxID=248454 RepID=A0A8S9XPY9_APOLU|nr:hypothetical protein GE061_013465 [Apolygus lucorum]
MSGDVGMSIEGIRVRCIEGVCLDERADRLGGLFPRHHFLWLVDGVDYWDFHWTSWLLFIVATFVAIGVAVAVAIVVAIVVAIDLVPQRLVPEVSSLPGVSMSCDEDRVECGDGMLIWCGDDHIGCGDDHGDIGIRVSIRCGDDRVRCGDDHIWCGDNHPRCGDGMPSRCADDLIHHGVGVPIWCADICVICGVGVPIWCVDDPIYK